MGQLEKGQWPGGPNLDLGLLDDFEVIAERAQVAEMLAALTDRYCLLNREMNRRGTLRWMVP